MNVNVPVNSTDKIVLILLAVLAVAAVRIVISFFKPEKPKADAKPRKRSAKTAGLTEVIVGIDGMMCGMCEAHMNELIRSNFKVKKVSSSAKDGETVIISEDALDIPWAKNKIKEIGYELVSYESEPYEKKGFFHFGRK